MAAVLGYLADNDADAAQIADAIVATWRKIDDALRPIIGQAGVAALYRRSLQLAGASHPCLGEVFSDTHHDSRAELDLMALKPALGRQSSAAAAAAGTALLRVFHDLLSGLVGSSLTDQLLLSVYAPTSGGPSAQDTSA